MAIWEVVAARRIGRETVQYVSNIYKYYLAYRLITIVIAAIGIVYYWASRREMMLRLLEVFALQFSGPPAAEWLDLIDSRIDVSGFEKWAKIRLAVLQGDVSKREILRREGIHWDTLKKILAHSEPPGYQMKAPRPNPKIGP